MEKCEQCGRNSKRYRMAFGSWICNNCKMETHHDTPPHSEQLWPVNSWWNELTNDSKILVFNEFKNKPPLQRRCELPRVPC